MNLPCKVLLIAEAANPQWVSVPLEGWSHSQAIRRIADAHVVTQVRNRAAFLEAGMVEGRDFTSIDSERVAAPLHWLATKIRGGAGRGWTTVTALESLSYYYFEWLVWRRFGEAIRRREYDIVHRLTPLSPTAASLLAKRCAKAGVPFVLGPINGGLPWPKEFQSARRREFEWLANLRGMHRLLPGYRATRKHAAAIIAGSLTTLEQVPARYRGKCVYIPENAIDPARFPDVQRGQPRRPLRVAFVGRLVPYKNPDVVIEALAPLAARGDVHVDIIGDGPMRPDLQRLIDGHRLASSVHLAGWVDHQQVQARLAQADVFAFPSIREFGGAAVLEAMAMGAVPVVVNYGGPGELVSPASGYRIELGNRQHLIDQLRRVVRELVNAPDALVPMRDAAMSRARGQYTWDAKASQVMQVYEWVLRQRDVKPDFSPSLLSRRAALPV